MKPFKEIREMSREQREWVIRLSILAVLYDAIIIAGALALKHHQ